MVDNVMNNKKWARGGGIPLVLLATGARTV